MRQEGITAYIILVVSVGRERAVLEELEKMEEVKDAKIVYGEYDIIARVEVGSMEELKSVVRKIRGLEGVLKSITLIASVRGNPFIL